ncbi:MAG: hypothetical protein JNL67_22375 [Planctomycetaceae bacterium]|nr:hypothetical protein [Planctomycetaceae bacterium]
MSNPWQPSPNRSFGSQGFPKPATPPLHHPSTVQSTEPHQPIGPSNSNLIWILIGVGVCGLLSLCCFSGLLVVYFQRPANMVTNADRDPFFRQPTNQRIDQSRNPNLAEYRKRIMAHSELLQQVGQIHSLEYSWHETVRSDDIEAVGFELQGSIRSGVVIAYESVVDGRTVLRKAVFKSKLGGNDELWMVF